MNYREFKHKAKELGCEIKETDKKIELYYWETGSIFAVSKLLEKNVELPSWIITDSQHDIIDLVLEFSRVPLSDRKMDTETESKPQKKEFKMRYKEFKEEVENLGYEVVEKPTFVEVQKNGYTVTSISMATNMMIDTYYVYFAELEERERTKLLELAFELAKTPIKEREDEKRFIIPLPRLMTTDGKQQYLTHKVNFFASRRDETLRQTWKEEHLKLIPEEYRQFAVEFDEK